jgi:hypothetical protein
MILRFSKLGNNVEVSMLWNHNKNFWDGESSQGFSSFLFHNYINYKTIQESVPIGFGCYGKTTNQEQLKHKKVSMKFTKNEFTVPSNTC